MARHSRIRSRARALDLELVEDLAEEVAVAEADHGAFEPERFERRREHLDQLDRPLRRIGADQLDADLAELAELPALRPHPPVDAARVGEAERPLLVGEPARHHAGDRHRHVVAEREHGAGLVEEAVGGRALRPLPLRDHLLVFDRRRRDLLVAALREQAEQRRLDRAQLAHLLREYVAGAGR